MSERLDLMVDIETLGNEMNSTIIQIAAIAFDITTGEEIGKFDRIANIERNKRPLKVSGSTLKWWLDTNQELFKELLNSGDLGSEGILYDFSRWLDNFDKSTMYLWGNGILFDNAMIKHQLESIDLEYPVHYKNDRDVRTLLELASQKLGRTEKDIKNSVRDGLSEKGLVAHNAFDDCKFQVSLATYCFNVLV